MSYSHISNQIAQILDNSLLGNGKIDALRDIINNLEAKEPSLKVRTLTIGYGFHYSNELPSQCSLLIIAACGAGHVGNTDDLSQKGHSLAKAAENENLRKTRECFADMALESLSEESIRYIMLSALLYADINEADSNKVSKVQSIILTAISQSLSK